MVGAADRGRAGRDRAAGAWSSTGAGRWAGPRRPVRATSWCRTSCPGPELTLALRSVALWRELAGAEAGGAGPGSSSRPRAGVVVAHDEAQLARCGTLAERQRAAGVRGHGAGSGRAAGGGAADRAGAGRGRVLPAGQPGAADEGGAGVPVAGPGGTAARVASGARRAGAGARAGRARPPALVTEPGPGDGAGGGERGRAVERRGGRNGWARRCRCGRGAGGSWSPSRCRLR